MQNVKYQIEDVDHKCRTWCSKMYDKIFLPSCHIRLHLYPRTQTYEEDQPLYKLGILMIRVCNESKY